jgi:hypothetical protein
MQMYSRVAKQNICNNIKYSRRSTAKFFIWMLVADASFLICLRPLSGYISQNSRLKHERKYAIQTGVGPTDRFVSRDSPFIIYLLVHLRLIQSLAINYRKTETRSCKANLVLHSYKVFSCTTLRINHIERFQMETVDLNKICIFCHVR